MNELVLRDWLISNNKELENKIYKDSAHKQCHWVNSTLIRLIFKDFDEISVPSSHMSKSINLPVYEFYSENLDVTITLRNNFYDWCFAVSKPLTTNMPKYFEDMVFMETGFFEGMDHTENFPFKACTQENEPLFAILLWIIQENFEKEIK